MVTPQQATAPQSCCLVGALLFLLQYHSVLVLDRCEQFVSHSRQRLQQPKSTVQSLFFRIGEKRQRFMWLGGTRLCFALGKFRRWTGQVFCVIFLFFIFFPDDAHFGRERETDGMLSLSH